VTIRNAAHSDIDALVSLLRELFAVEADFFFDADKQRRGLLLMLDGCRKHRCVRVAEQDNEVIGMCSAQTLISTAEGGAVALVEDLVVKTGWRGRGVGRMLLASMEDWRRERGLKRLQLLADAENEPALAFYQNNGWKRTQLICLRKR